MDGINVSKRIELNLIQGMKENLVIQTKILLLLLLLFFILCGSLIRIDLRLIAHQSGAHTTGLQTTCKYRERLGERHTERMRQWEITKNRDRLRKRKTESEKDWEREKESHSKNKKDKKTCRLLQQPAIY